MERRRLVEEEDASADLAEEQAGCCLRESSSLSLSVDWFAHFSFPLLCVPNFPSLPTPIYVSFSRTDI
jgi:hypothetical protein